MKIQFAFITLMIIFVITASCQSKKQAASKEVATGDNSKTSLDWDGTYSGILPCADCSGIKTQLTLNKDLSYILKSQYTGKSDSVFSETGKFEWNKNGGSISLNNQAKRQYLVGENVLFHLDMDGNRITGNLEEDYLLKKEISRLTGKYWKLVTLNGQTELNSNREPFIKFDEENGMNGNSGCNNFMGSYTLTDNNEISFSPLAMTRMACIGNNTEQELMQAIETTKKVTYSVNELIFLDGSGKELAIFEADFFK